MILAELTVDDPMSGETFVQVRKEDDELLGLFADDGDEKSYVPLDRHAQHALYLILKNRFEE